MKIIATSLILILVTTATVNSLDAEIETRIDHVFNNIFIPLTHVPGIALGIVRETEGSGDSILFSKAYGWRDVENNIYATNNTKFLIASITKTFTSTLIVKTLSERFPELGEYALEVPLKQLLPGSNFTFSDRYRSESMSFRDLMSHRHCLNTANLGMGSGAFENAAEWAYRTRYAEEGCEFRTFAAYSNGMYNLLGKLVGELAGSTYESLLENLMQSIGMTSSTYVKESVDYDLLENMSRGYFRRNGLWEKMNPELYKRITVALAGGGIVSTPSDMVKYMQFHLNYGRVGNQQIVREDAMKWLHTGAVSLPFLTPRENEAGSANGLYAMGTGFSLGLYDGWSFSHHGGDWAPFLSSMTLYPDINLGIFTTLNGPGHLPAELNQNYLHEQVFDILMGIERTSKVPVIAEKLNSKKSEAYVEKAKKNYSGKVVDFPQLAGVYGHPAEGEFEIIYNASDINSPLYLKFGKWVTGYMYYIDGTDLFRVYFDSDIVQEFYSAGGTREDGFIDVSVDNVAGFILFGEKSDFIKNATLATLPEIPWAPNSCGPASTVKNEL